MTSRTKIAQLARIKSGGNINIDIPADKAMSLLFDITKNAMLSSHYWNFAKTRVSLTEDAIPPEGDQWATQYSLPVDCLSIYIIYLSSGAELIRYSHENHKILCNVTGEIQLVYIKQEENTSKYHPLFVEALATKIAFEEAEHLTNSNVKKQILAQEYDEKIALARKINAISLPPEPIWDTSFVYSRF
jgi:hypothetical protein